MALTQMQLIQSLGEAMSWFERELNWGVPPTELRHLCGRIGELYAALISTIANSSDANTSTRANRAKHHLHQNGTNSLSPPKLAVSNLNECLHGSP
jgi:hypothetical protein